METIVNVWQSAPAQALGWTLIHSLWQGSLCYLLGMVLLRYIPLRRSSLRYAAALAVLGLMLISSVATFLTVFAPEVAVQPEAVNVSLLSYSYNVASVPPASTWSSRLLGWSQGHIGFLSGVWMIGAFLFLLRNLAGYWYVGFIRQSATPVGGYWQRRVDELAQKLDIRVAVEVAQSAIVGAPIVMGYFKPAILVPVGMFSGLTTDQLEAIFIHELIHIRRGDYLVNLTQTIFESVYFFNPFVWMMSASVRREREHCCDDGVVTNQANAVAYVHALAMLEEAKLSRTGLALSLADDKNQLLNRIKRIMEKSVHRYSGRDRVIPAALLVIGLMCASWLTIHSGDRKAAMQRRPDELTVATIAMPDTVVKGKSGAYYHYSITTVDENGKENVRVVEGYDEDGELDNIAGIEPPVPVEPIELIEPPVPVMFDIVVPANIDVPHPVGPLSVMPPMPRVPMPMHFRIAGPDTIPGNALWKEFDREFEESFRGRFEDFYLEHESEMKEMMKEFEKKFGELGAKQDEFEHIRGAFRGDQARIDENFARRAAELASKGEQMQRDNAVVLAKVQRSMELAQLQATLDQMRVVNMDGLGRNMAKLGESMNHLQQRLHESQELVRKAAVKDGYLKESEEINTINMNEEGMEINGKKIKAADAKRYREIMHAAEERRLD